MTLYDNISEIRQLLREIEPVTPPAAANDDPATKLRRAFEYHEFNTSLPVVEQSPRARALRTIDRLAGWRSWGPTEIVRTLDAYSVSSTDALSDEAVDRLCARMQWLEDAAQTGCDPDDEPPAR